MDDNIYEQNVIEHYKNLDIVHLWKSHCNTRQNLEKAIQKEDVDKIKKFKIESKVLCGLIKEKSIDDKIWLLNQLRDKLEVYKEQGKTEMRAFLEREISFVENNYF